jgi:hypothetical protein
VAVTALARSITGENMGLPKKQADCHPERVHVAKGLCRYCYHRKYQKANPEYFRRASMRHFRKRLYGITDEEFNRRKLEQKSCCAICGRHESVVGTLCMDHNHNTKELRMLLCSCCNRGIGFFFENSEALRNAAKYLEKYSGEDSDEHRNRSGSSKAGSC